MEKDDKLIGYIERLERLNEEKKELSADISEVFAQAKGDGYDAKAIRQVLKLRKMAISDREEYKFLVDEYQKLLDMVVN